MPIIRIVLIIRCPEILKESYKQIANYKDPEFINNITSYDNEAVSEILNTTEIYLKQKS